MATIEKMLQVFTHDNLREWAGSTIYSRGRRYVSHVAGLSQTDAGLLVAWVSGTADYAVSVSERQSGELDHSCSCPYDQGGPCKHVIAVVLAASEQLNTNQCIPLLDPDDELHLLFDDSQEDRRDDLVATYLPTESLNTDIEKVLRQKSKKELLTLLIDLAVDFPEVAHRIHSADYLDSGQIDLFVRSLRKEIRHLTAEPAWSNHRNHEQHLPDYSEVEKQFQALFDKGHSDVLFELGNELWDRGNQQISQSDDDSDTATAIASCLEIVLMALPRTLLTPPEQLLWLINRALQDEYGLLESAGEFIHDDRYSKAHWREVAADLDQQLKGMALPQSGKYTEKYRRKQLVDWLNTAYQWSGQSTKIIPLLKKEAARCFSYDTLIDALLEIGQRDEAQQWCIKGFNLTRVDARGIAGSLRERLIEMATEDGTFDLVASYRADDFFSQPSLTRFEKLRTAAEKIQRWPIVRRAVLTFLMNGKQPVSRGKGKDTWPLSNPPVEWLSSRGNLGHDKFPAYELLITLAIQEKRNNDAVELFQVLCKNRRWKTDIDRHLAEAVKESHPEITLQVWLSTVEQLIKQVNPKAYREAVNYLRRIHRLYQSTGQLEDWRTLLQRLRTEHKAKRRLQEELDALLDNRRLIN